MTQQIYVDETKYQSYLLVAVTVPREETERLRGELRKLVLPGQRRLHMKNESNPRKRLIASVIGRSATRATVYDAGRRYRSERERRAACLGALVDDIRELGGGLLVLEQDDTLLGWDNQRLIEYTRNAALGENFRYEHRRASTEQMLAIPDAVAWCWAKGGDWRQRIQPVINDVRRV